MEGGKKAKEREGAESRGEIIKIDTDVWRGRIKLSKVPKSCKHF